MMLPAQLDIPAIIRDGAALALAMSLYVIWAFRLDPRFFISRYPKSVQNALSQNAPGELWLRFALGTGLFVLLGGGSYVSQTLAFRTSPSMSFPLLWLHGFLVASFFNFADWFILDELWQIKLRSCWTREADTSSVHLRRALGLIIGFIPCGVFAAAGAWAAINGY
jgi:hypothetical protein